MHNLQDCCTGCVCIHAGITSGVSKKQKMALPLGIATAPLCSFPSDLPAVTSPGEECALNSMADRSWPEVSGCISKPESHHGDTPQDPGVREHGHLLQSKAVPGSPGAATHRPWQGRASGYSCRDEMLPGMGHSTAPVIQRDTAEPVHGRAVAHSPGPYAGNALALATDPDARAAWLQEESDVAAMMPLLVQQAEAYNVRSSAHDNCICQSIVCIAVKPSSL